MEKVKVYKWAKIANMPYKELDELYRHAESLANKYDIEISFGDKIKIYCWGYVKECDYPPYPNKTTLMNSLDLWTENIEKEFEEWFDSLDSDEEDNDDEITLSDILPYANEMGMSEEELSIIAEDMGIF